MKITSEKIENSQIKLNIEAEQSEIDNYLEKAYKELAERVSVPGFRKGKTPRDVLESFIGKDALFREALEHLIPDLYEKAIKEKQIIPIARAQIELVKRDPVIFNAIVPVQPEANLGDYRNIRIEFVKPEIDEKVIDETLERLQYQHSVLMPVERKTEFGDIVTMDIEIIEQGKQPQARNDFVYELIQGSSLPLPGFVEEIIGLNKGDEKNFDISYPPDYETEDLAEKKFSFKIKIKEIKKRELPQLNDDFAKTLELENLVALREKIYNDLKSMADRKAELDYEGKILEKIAEISKIEYPPAIVEAEIENILEEEAKNFKDGLKGMENYLALNNLTLQDHRKELYNIASKKIVNSLIINKISEEENITIEESEIENEIDSMVQKDSSRADEIKEFFLLPQARKSVEIFLKRRKTIELLKQIASGKLD